MTHLAAPMRLAVKAVIVRVAFDSQAVVSFSAWNSPMIPTRKPLWYCDGQASALYFSMLTYGAKIEFPYSVIGFMEARLLTGALLVAAHT